MGEEKKDKVDWSEALLGAKLSKFAYEKFEDDEKILLPHLLNEGLALVNSINLKKTGTQCFIAKKDEVYFLVFRGTEKDGLDIISDLNAKLQPGDSGEQHTGFKKAFESVKEEIKKNIPENTEVFVTGHSLGGALATFAFEDLKMRNSVRCYTFGAPSVGVNEINYNSKEDKIYRFINHGDIVPRALKVGAMVPLLARLLLPALKAIYSFFKWNTDKFETWGDHLKNFSKDLFRYKQPVGGILLQENGLVSFNSDEAFSFTIFFKVIFSSSYRELLSDHAIQKYCDEIELVLERTK